MIFGESPLKDLYRKAVWGLGPRGSILLPVGAEALLVRTAGRAAALGSSRQDLAQRLALAFPEHSPASLQAIAGRAHAAHFSNQYIGFSFPRITDTTWPRYLRFEGLDALIAARDAGGVMLTHPHMGPAQLPLHVLGILGWPMHQIGGGRVTEVQLSPVGQWAAERRWSLEDHMPVTLHDGAGFMRPVLRALQAGAVVMSACDGTGGGEELGLRAPRRVCGQVIGVPVGPARLAYQADVPLMTIRTVRDRTGQALFVSEIGPALAFDRSSKAAAMDTGATATAHYLHHSLQRHAGAWHFWDSFAPGKQIRTDPADALAADAADARLATWLQSRDLP